jgi:hypothetical protein
MGLSVCVCECAAPLQREAEDLVEAEPTHATSLRLPDDTLAETRTTKNTHILM